MSTLPSRPVLLAVTVASLGAVAAALVSQHRFGMEPCPWCILQRVLFLAMAVLALLGAAQPSAALRRALAFPLALLAAGGMASALWQHFVAAQTASCALTLADRIVGATGLDVRFPEVFEVRASCAEAAVNLLGVPYAFWSLALFALLGLLSLSVLRRSARRRA